MAPRMPFDGSCFCEIRPGLHMLVSLEAPPPPPPAVRQVIPRSIRVADSFNRSPIFPASGLYFWATYCKAECYQPWYHGGAVHFGEYRYYHLHLNRVSTTAVYSSMTKIAHVTHAMCQAGGRDGTSLCLSLLPPACQKVHEHQACECAELSAKKCNTCHGHFGT